RGGGRGRRPAARAGRALVRAGGQRRARLARPGTGDGSGRGARGGVLSGGRVSRAVRCLMLDVGLCAQLACVWEATARKAGNVHRFQDFEDLSYLDFLLSASAIAQVFAKENSYRESVGSLVRECVRATRRVVATNSNLGIILLLAPLAAAV